MVGPYDRAAGIFSAESSCYPENIGFLSKRSRLLFGRVPYMSNGPWFYQGPFMPWAASAHRRQALAIASSRRATISAFSCLSASDRGVRPSAAGFGGAPRSSSKLSGSRCSDAAVRCAGVKPCLSLGFTSALRSSKNNTRSMLASGRHSFLVSDNPGILSGVAPLSNRKTGTIGCTGTLKKSERR